MEIIDRFISLNSLKYMQKLILLYFIYIFAYHLHEKQKKIKNKFLMLSNLK